VENPIFSGRAALRERAGYPAGYAKDHQPCVIFMDEIDAIGGRRFSEGAPRHGL
jgi:ATP-dependent Zn protease